MHVPPGTDLERVAERVRYVGSTDHKDYPSFAGPLRPRRDASLCPREIKDQDMVTGWLRDALRRGHVGSPWKGEFPRYVWHREGDTVFEAMLVNQGNGTYKGYPLSRSEWPRGMDKQRG